MTPALIPELDVESLERSLVFYTEVLGFTVMFSREDEKFAYLNLGDAHLMLEEAAGPGRRFTTAPLEYPHGRGVNFQIRVSDVDAIYQHVLAAGCRVVIVLEERWYRANDRESGNRQFVVVDPDGYLLRFFTDIGERPV